MKPICVAHSERGKEFNLTISVARLGVFKAGDLVTIGGRQPFMVTNSDRSDIGVITVRRVWLVTFWVMKAKSVFLRAFRRAKMCIGRKP